MHPQYVLQGLAGVQESFLTLCPGREHWLGQSACLGLGGVVLFVAPQARIIWGAWSPQDITVYPTRGKCHLYLRVRAYRNISLG